MHGQGETPRIKFKAHGKHQKKRRGGSVTTGQNPRTSWVRSNPRRLSFFTTSTVVEIESAADAFSVPEKQELLLLLATRLQACDQTLPPPRRFAPEQVAAWVAADEAQ